MGTVFSRISTMRMTATPRVRKRFAFEHTAQRKKDQCSLPGGIIDVASTIDSDEISFRDLECVLAFSQSEHLARAAETLGCTAGAVQRRLRGIEARLGIPLIERDGRRIRLLHAGRVLAERAAYVVRSRGEAVDAVRAVAGRSTGVVRIGHMFSLGLDVVPRYVASLRRLRPGLRIALRQGRTNAILAALLAGEIDAAFVSPVPNEPDLIAIALFSEGVRLAVPAHDALASRRSVDPAELRDRVFVSIGEGAASRVELVQTCARAGFVPQIAIEVADMCTLESVIARGIAISIVPEEMRHHGHPGVARIPLRDTPPTRRTAAFVYPRGARTDGALGDLIAIARKEARAALPAKRRG